MRAAVFVNLVTMRKVMDHGGNGHVQLAPCNLEILQKSNYLFHSAHNRPLTLTGRVCVCALHVLLMCAFAVFVQIFYVTAKGLRWNPWKQTNYFGSPVQNTTSYLAPK